MKEVLVMCLPAKRPAEDSAADFTARQYAMWDAGLKLPTQTQDDRARCFCAGVRIHLLAAHKGDT
jgi:hypothetical protein